MKKLKIIILLMFLVKDCFGDVSLWVEKNIVGVGEKFNLHIEASNIDNTEEPELSKIKGLKILSRSEQNKTFIKGNKINRTVKIIITLDILEIKKITIQYKYYILILKLI